MRRLTGRTSVPTIDLNGEIMIGWSPQMGQKILDRIAKKKEQAGDPQGPGPSPADTCTQDFKK